MSKGKRLNPVQRQHMAELKKEERALKKEIRKKKNKFLNQYIDENLNKSTSQIDNMANDLRNACIDQVGNEVLGFRASKVL